MDIKDKLTVKDGLMVKGTITVMKFNRDIEEYRDPVTGEIDYERFYAENEPYEVKTFNNLFLTNGIETLWKLFIGQSGVTPFNSSNAHVGVGDGTTAPSASQTGLTGTNKFFKVVDSGYPTVSGNTVTFQSTFSGTEANFTWNEFGVANGNNPPTTGVLFNRATQSLGTKQSGQTWALRVTLSIS
jgi:hypothetical protein